MWRLLHVMAKILESIGLFGLVVLPFAGLCLHLFTIIFAYAASGFFAALLTLVLPVLSQVYWLIWAWNSTGNLVNGFSGWVFLYLAALILCFAFVYAAGWLREKVS